MTNQKGSRLFFYGEKTNGENLGFESTTHTLSELVKLEPFNPEWGNAGVAGVDKMRGICHNTVASSQVDYEAIINRVKYMVSGRSHVFLVTTEEELYVCGYNAYLQCGCSDDTESVPYFKRIDLDKLVEPIREKATEFKVTKISCGWVHSVLLINDKYLFGAGHNYFYQTGITQSGTFAAFTYIPLDHLDLPPNYKITHIEGGTFFTVFAVNNRKLYGTGSAGCCNFGVKQTDNVHQYMFAHEFDCDIARIEPGYDHTLVLLKDNRIFMAGKMEGNSGDSTTIEAFKQVDFNASINDWIDIGVCKFNYKSFILKNDTIYQLSAGVPELVKKNSQYERAHLYTSNLSLLIVHSSRQHVENIGNNNNNEKSFELEIPSGFTLDHISAGYTSIYIVVKPKSSLLHFFNKLKDAIQCGKLSDITII